MMGCEEDLEEIRFIAKELLEALERGDLERAKILARDIIEICIYGVQ